MSKAAIKATVPKISAINGIGGPQTSMERDAGTTKEIDQDLRISLAQECHRIVVKIVSRSAGHNLYDGLHLLPKSVGVR